MGNSKIVKHLILSGFSPQIPTAKEQQIDHRWSGVLNCGKIPLFAQNCFIAYWICMLIYGKWHWNTNYIRKFSWYENRFGRESILFRELKIGAECIGRQERLWNMATYVYGTISTQMDWNGYKFKWTFKFAFRSNHDYKQNNTI